MTDALEIEANSEYIAFVDESGDHGLQNFDAHYPIFILVCCIIKKSHYFDKIIPEFQKLKIDFWQNDTVILHENDLRKDTKEFAIFRSDKELKKKFLERLDRIISESNFHICYSYLDKIRNKSIIEPSFQLKERDVYSNLAFSLMQTTKQYLYKYEGNPNKIIKMYFEGRGKKENNELNRFFKFTKENSRRLLNGDSFENFEIEIIPKSQNMIGLQLVDLVARPIALNILKPWQNNTSFNTIKPKLLL